LVRMQKDWVCPQKKSKLQKKGAEKGGRNAEDRNQKKKKKKEKKKWRGDHWRLVRGPCKRDQEGSPPRETLGARPSYRTHRGGRERDKIVEEKGGEGQNGLRETYLKSSS